MKIAVFSDIHEKHRLGKTLWANPGDLMGRYGQPGFGLYDTAEGEFSHVDLAR